MQGVGFRFTAEALANDLGIGGWTKNLRDGRVEVLCEGDEVDLASFINKMKNGPMRHYISAADIEWEDAKDEFKDFTVRFDK